MFDLVPTSRLTTQIRDNILDGFADWFDDQWFSFNSLLEPQKNNFPKINSYTEDGKFIVEVALAGYNKENIKVDYLERDGVISISASTSNDKSDDKRNYTCRQIKKSSFSQTFSLPQGLGMPLTSKFEDGILKLVWNAPKELVEQKKVKQIKVE